MCGIVCVLSRPATRPVPTPDEVLGWLDAATDALRAGDPATAADAAARADLLLRGESGLACLLGHGEMEAALLARLDALDPAVEGVATRHEAEAERAAHAEDAAARGLVIAALRDATWALRHDRLRTARAVDDLAGRGASREALAAYLSIQQVFAGIDRLEVRGRDSAGVHVLAWGHGLDPADRAVAALLADRTADPLFAGGSVRVTPGAWSFVYKAAAEIGELGDNTRVMRDAVRADALLRLVVSRPGARVQVMGHTRWASVGIISEPNAHPVNSEELERRADDPYLVAALNGDVDNHADLRVTHGLRVAEPITTDAKVIPTIVARRLADGEAPEEAFRATVAQFDGSHGIAVVAAADPGRVLLSLRGSGQGLCVGLAEDRYLVASEPYGIVEETMRYVRMDGEALADPADPASRGQVLVADADRAGELAGLRMRSHGGAEIPLGDADLRTAEVTTRDIHRGDHRHYLAKEIAESPRSVHKTLAGRIEERDGALRAALPEPTLPAAVRERLAAGGYARVHVIGQGTAAIAGRALARLLAGLVGDRLRVAALPATELSGFGLGLDMRDTLVVAISQSGTTTDTNRTVDLARQRGATVLAIVNRRGSELAAKSDGVMYTSDGRDVEMSVASTKAFYAQVAAGVLYACAIAEATHGAASPDAPGAADRHTLLVALRALPSAMQEVLALRGEVGELARRHAPARRYWTVVGNGMNSVAAEEVRIKLSELCYKSIACDVTEDKKHIDLSCEPLIFVCAAGLGEGTAADVSKEIAIYRAHKALPIVVASRGGNAFDAATGVVRVPEADPRLAFLLAVMVGHLFGYEAALAIDALARPLRESREVIERVVGRGGRGSDLLARVRTDLGVPARRFFDALATGAYDGNLEASTAVRIVNAVHDTLSADPLRDFERRSGKVATPEALLEDVTAALTRGVDELTRPVDAIKHQAKTVTVGISRSDEGLLDRPLVRAVMEAGASRESLSYGTLKVLAALDPAVREVAGYTRYRVEGDPVAGAATISIVDRGGMSRNLASRVDRNPVLVGTKRRVASEQQVLVARGRSDGRTVVFVPETKSGETTGITLLHVVFEDRLPAAVMRGVLEGYDRRYERLVDWVTETEGAFRDDRLAEVPVADLLILPISDTADLWRAGGTR
jgi:glucosamine--fructose-6-phosphate aminotransferase (isomerizing)